MIVNGNKTLKELKDEFTLVFPGLKLEFYKSGHKPFEGTKPEDNLEDSVRVIDLNQRTEAIELDINESMTASELEEMFKERFNLNAQIFRRSKELWLQTTRTDNWSLKVQNSKGLHSLN